MCLRKGRKANKKQQSSFASKFAGIYINRVLCIFIYFVRYNFKSNIQVHINIEFTSLLSWSNCSRFMVPKDINQRLDYPHFILLLLLLLLTTILSIFKYNSSSRVNSRRKKNIKGWKSIEIWFKKYFHVA